MKEYSRPHLHQFKRGYKKTPERNRRVVARCIDPQCRFELPLSAFNGIQTSQKRGGRF